MATFLLALLGGLGFRIRGDSIVSELLGGSATQVGRAIWALSLSIPAAIFYGPLYLLLAPALFVGAMPGWYGSVDLGNNENSFERDLYVMAMRGIFFTLPAGIVLYFLGHNNSMIFAWSGILCPLLYSIGWLVPIKNRWIGKGTPLSEALFGTYVGTMLGLTLGNVL